jgi:hypothetical protein
MSGIVFDGVVNLTEMRIGGDLVLKEAYFTEAANFVTTKVGGENWRRSGFERGVFYGGGQFCNNEGWGFLIPGLCTIRRSSLFCWN